MAGGKRVGERPKPEEFPNTPQGLHDWAQAVRNWNQHAGVTSRDIIKEWNERNTRG